MKRLILLVTVTVVMAVSLVATSPANGIIIDWSEEGLVTAREAPALGGPDTRLVEALEAAREAPPNVRLASGVITTAEGANSPIVASE